MLKHPQSKDPRGRRGAWKFKSMGGNILCRFQLTFPDNAVRRSASKTENVALEDSEISMSIISAAVMEMLLLGSGMLYSPGQGSAWQAWVSLPLPSQSLPPSWGTGALQWRILVICPSPQVTEHDDHGDHKLQPPSCRTGIRKWDHD